MKWPINADFQIRVFAANEASLQLTEPKAASSGLSVCVTMADEIAKAKAAQAGGTTIFAKIVSGAIPTDFLYEDDQVNIECIDSYAF